MKRTVCGACGSADLALILDLGSSPLADNFPSTPNEPAKTYPLQMLQCASCKLAQIGEVVDDVELWRDGYAFYSSTSQPLRTHFESYFNDVMSTTNGLGSGQGGSESNPRRRGSLVVDVGCNDGLFLGHWRRAGFNAIGIDPAAGPVMAARESGLNVIHDDFGLSLARSVVGRFGHASLVTANNVAAHVADLSDFLAGLAHLLDHYGLLVMEVQYLPDLLVGNGFDMLYHEHRFFWALNPMRRALARVGLELVHVEHVSTQGGSVRVYVQHESNPGSMLIDADGMYVRTCMTLADERRSMGPDVITGLQVRADRVAARLHDELGALAKSDRTIVGYGAPAKATTLLHWTGTAGYLSWVEDTTPAKVGRYIPGTNVEIRKPTGQGSHDDRPDAYLLLAWNYARDVLHGERGYLDDGGRFVVPLPAPITFGAPL